MDFSVSVEEGRIPRRASGAVQCLTSWTRFGLSKRTRDESSFRSASLNCERTGNNATY